MISIAAAFRAAASKRSVLFFLKSCFLKPNTDNKTAGDAEERYEESAKEEPSVPGPAGCVAVRAGNREF